MAVMAPSAFSVTMMAPGEEAVSAVETAVETLTALNAKETYCASRSRKLCEDTVRRYHVSAEGCTLTIGEAERTYYQDPALRPKYTKHHYTVDLTRVEAQTGTYSDYYRKWHSVWLKRTSVNVADGRTQWIMRFPGFRNAAEPRELKSVLDAAIAECKAAGEAQTS